jgi:hypothetical protein
VQDRSAPKRGGLVFDVQQLAHHRSPGARTRTYIGEVDYFAVHSPETGGVYLIPIQDVQTRRSCALRVSPPVNGQRKRIRRAADYEIANVEVKPI